MYGILNHPNKGEYATAGPLIGALGNGNCDDWLNKVECNYDAGDCCGSNVNIGFCHSTKGTVFGTKYCKGTDEQTFNEAT